MMMNYHEMTMTEGRDSKAKRQQFMVITTVMAAALAYSAMTSGAFQSINPTNGVFPGGNYCYKHTSRDYAASMGLGRVVMTDLVGAKPGGVARNEAEEITYHVYLDDPARMGGRRQRWMTGILVGDRQKDKVKQLQALNKSSSSGKKEDKRLPTADELEEGTAKEIFEMTPYEYADLPSVDALVLQFPNTHGFVSSLVQSYKVSAMPDINIPVDEMQYYMIILQYEVWCR
jgi:hypothetical protein